MWEHKGSSGEYNLEKGWNTAHRPPSSAHSLRQCLSGPCTGCRISLGTWLTEIMCTYCAPLRIMWGKKIWKPPIRTRKLWVNFMGWRRRGKKPAVGSHCCQTVSHTGPMGWTGELLCVLVQCTAPSLHAALLYGDKRNLFSVYKTKETEIAMRKEAIFSQRVSKVVYVVIFPVSSCALWYLEFNDFIWQLLHLYAFLWTMKVAPSQLTCIYWATIMSLWNVTSVLKKLLIYERS